MERPIRKLGVNCDCIRGKAQTETLQIMKEVGFEAYFTGAYTREAVAPIKKAGDALGLTLNSLHAPFGGINNLWMPGMSYRKVYQQIIETIDAAAENGVPAIVLHVSSGWYAPEVNDLGLSRYDALVGYAEDRGVHRGARGVPSLCRRDVRRYGILQRRKEAD